MFGSQCSSLQGSVDLINLFLIDDAETDATTLCQIMDSFVSFIGDKLQELSVDVSPLNVGATVTSFLGAVTPSWISEDGRITIGQNTALCQVEPDPFAIYFEDIHENALIKVLQDSESIVTALTDVASECLGDGITITDASFDDIQLEVNEDGQLVMTGSVWGTNGKNPAAILR